MEHDPLKRSDPSIVFRRWMTVAVFTGKRAAVANHHFKGGIGDFFERVDLVRLSQVQDGADVDESDAGVGVHGDLDAQAATGGLNAIDILR